MSGSSRVARGAGPMHATTATIAINTTTDTRVTGSLGLVWTRSVGSRRPSRLKHARAERRTPRAEFATRVGGILVRVGLIGSLALQPRQVRLKQARGFVRHFKRDFVPARQEYRPRARRGGQHILVDIFAIEQRIRLAGDDQGRYMNIALFILS